MTGDHRAAGRQGVLTDGRDDRVDDTAGLDPLVAVAATGDRAAVERLLVILRPIVVRLCRARLRGPERGGAEDVAQEVLLAVLRGLPGYHAQGRSFLAWVHGIAAHKVSDALRTAQRRPPAVAEGPEIPDPTPGPEDLALRRETVARMRAALDALPARQRDVVVLRVAVGLSAAETADAVGTSPGAVRVAQHRALTALRGRARELLPEEPALLEEDMRSDFAAAPVTGDPALDVLLADAETALGELGR